VRICVLGGIFGMPADYRAAVTHTPETVLAAGLRARGHDVVEHGHRGPFRLQGFDVVHVHHLALGAVVAASEHPPVRLAYTSHWLRHRRLPRRAAARYVVARADAVVALSETEARWQQEAYPGVSARQAVIANGIDEDVFAFREPRPPAPGEPWRLLYVGQLSRFKGVHFLLQALALIDSSLPVELDLAYQVDFEEDALRREAASLNVREVRFLGPKTPAELARLYAAAHVLVLPSTGEALPSVISEAAFVGRPAVATDVGAVREQVADFGEVVAPRDPAALAAALTRVLSGYDRFVRDARPASERTRRRYSVAAMIDGHERMYEALARRTPPTRSRAGSVVDASVRLALRAGGRRFRT